MSLLCDKPVKWLRRLPPYPVNEILHGAVAGTEKEG